MHDLWLSLMLRHGDRVPPQDNVAIDAESYPYADRLFADIVDEYPDAQILSIIAAAGRLHIDCALPSGGDHDLVRHARFSEWLRQYTAIGDDDHAYC